MNKCQKCGEELLLKVGVTGYPTAYCPICDLPPVPIPQGRWKRFYWSIRMAIAEFLHYKVAILAEGENNL